mgnify:CR=1 FL=1
MPVTPTIEVDDTLKERSSHGSFELPIETYSGWRLCMMN